MIYSPFFRYFILLFVCFVAPVKADMIKCKVSSKIWNYYESSDKKQARKCIGKSILVSRSDTKYKKPSINKKSENLIAAKDINSKDCGGSGGTIKVNGRTFHIDKAAICRKYTDKGKGSIASAKYTPKLFKVNGDFRRKIASYVRKTARKHGMEPEFIHAIISAESAYNPNAQSHAGAQGLMQLMPFTGKRFGVTNPFDPYQNIEAGTKYLKILYKEFGSLELAAAGYNAGEGSVRKYNNSIPPYKETMKYVPKVLAYYRKYKNNQSLIAGN